MAGFEKDKAIIDALAGLNKPKATTSKLPGTRVQKSTDGLLASLDAAAKRQKSGVAPTATGSFIKSTEVDAALNKSGSLLQNLLVPLTILDTPRRAIISGARELTDLLDSDPNTKASFGDFYNQTKDSTYGFGKAFPMKGWAGRVTGFLGDVLFDPLTYATLGGTVAAKSVVTLSAKELARMGADDIARLAVKKKLADGSVQVATRSVIGKTVVGREGRQKLAAFAKRRMQQAVEDGTRQMSPQDINRIAGDIASDGKRALKEVPWLADDIGVKGPGVYYFGSRVKVPGTGVLGQALETGITKTRLGAVNSDLLGKVQQALTPKGVGRIEQFGPNAIRNFRVQLARGGLTPDEVNVALSVVEADDFKRLRLSGHAEQASNDIANTVDEARGTAIPMQKLLDNVADPASVPGVSPEDVVKARNMRAVLDQFITRVQERATQMGGRVPGRVEQGYFPRMQTDDQLRWRLLVGESGADDIMYGGMVDDAATGSLPVDKTRTASVFKERDLKAGDTWFGHVLAPEDMSVDRLNYLARNPPRDVEGVTFDMFETDIANVMAKYVRSYGDQMATYDMLEKLATESPDLLTFVNKTLGLDAAYVKDKMFDTPNRLLNEMTVALRSLIAAQENGVGAVDDALRETYGSLQAAKEALTKGTASAGNVDELRLALKQAVDAIGANNEEYLRLFRMFDDYMSDVDGVSNYKLIVAEREKLAQEFEQIKKMLDDLPDGSDPTRELIPSDVEAVRARLADHLSRVQRFERDLDAINDVHEFLPTIGSFSVIDGQPVFDALNQIVKTENRQVGVKSKVQGFIRSWMMPADKRYGWTDDVKKAILKLDNNKVNERLAFFASKTDVLTDAEIKELDVLGKYVFALMDANEKALGRNVLINDRANGITKLNGKQTRYGKWKNASTHFASGQNKKSEGAYVLQDMMHEETSLAMYLEWRDILEPYGITVGDDVVEEIMTRNLEPLVDQARTLGDAERLAYLEDPKFMQKSFNDMNHPLSYHSRARTAIAHVDDILEEMADWSRESARLGGKPVSSRRGQELASMTPIERKAYQKHLRRQNLLKKEYQDAIKMNREQLVEADGDMLWTEDMARRIKDTVTERFRKKASEAKQTPAYWVKRFDEFTSTVEKTLADNPLTDKNTFNNWVSANKRLINVMRKLGQDIYNIKPGDPGYGLVRRKIAERGLSFDKPYESVMTILLDSLDEQVDNTISRAVNAADLQRQDIVRTIVNNESAVLKADDALGVGPKQFIESPMGQVARRELLVQREAATRGVEAGADIIDTKDRKVLRRIFNELTNSDAYPIYKSTQNKANIVHSLALLGDSTDFMGISFLPEEWDAIVSGETLDTVQNKVRAIVQQAKRKQTLEVTAPGDVLERGIENISDEFAVRKYVEWLISQDPDNAVDSVVATSRQKRIIKNWRNTESYDYLSRVNGVRAKMIESFNAEQAANPMRMADKASKSLDELSELNQRVTQQLDEWTQTDTDELADALEQALSVREREFVTGIEDVVRNRRSVYEQNPDEVLDSIETARRQASDMGDRTDDAMDFTVQDAIGFQPASSGVVNPRLANWDELSTQSLNLLEQAKAGRSTIDRILKTPLERKSEAQLIEEIKILRALREGGIETDYTKGKVTKLLRERSKLLSDVSMDTQAMDAAGLSPQQKLAAIIKQRKEAQTNAMDELMNPEDTQAWRQVESGADVRTTTARATQDELNVMSTTPDEMADSASTKSVFGKGGDLASDWDDPLFFNKKTRAYEGPEIVREKSIPRKTEVDANALAKNASNVVKREASKAESLVNDLRSRYDALAAVEADIDPARLGALEGNIKYVMDLLDEATTPQGSTVRRGSDRAGIAIEYSNKTGDLYERHQSGKRLMKDALAIVEHIGSKDKIDIIDAVIFNQAESEVQFWQTAMRLTDAQAEARTVAGIEQMINNGGRVLDDGRILLRTGEIVDGLPMDAFVETAANLKKNWQVLNNKYFPGLQASPEFKALWDSASRIEDPEFVRKLAYYIGPYTKFFKAYATLSPGFHVRNAISNAVQLVLADADVDNMIKATPYYFRWLKAQKAGTSWEDFLKTVEPEMVARLDVARQGALGGGGGIFSETFKEATGGSRIYDNWLIRKNQAIGQASDNYSRFVLAFDSAMKGGDTGMAQARVKRFFFDYEDLSSVDKVMRQIIPFWLFYSRNLSTQITNMWLNPKPYLIYNSFKRNFEGEDPAPPFVREMGGFRLPFGEGLYAMPDIAFTRIPQELSDLTNPLKMMNKTNPLFKIPVEQIAGENAFTGKQFETGQDRLMAALLGIAPPAGQAERLFGRDGLSQLNAWLGYTGSPIRKYK